MIRLTVQIKTKHVKPMNTWSKQQSGKNYKTKQQRLYFVFCIFIFDLNLDFFSLTHGGICDLYCGQTLRGVRHVVALLLASCLHLYLCQ